MKGPDEKIKIPGWYDDVVEPSEIEENLLAEMPFEEEAKKREFGLKEFLGGLKGLEALKTLYFSTTSTICGLDAGYKGPGSKTVLPCEASAKMDFRLVERQRPEKLLRMLREYLNKKGFSDVEIIIHGAYEPAKTPPTDPFARYFIETVERVYGSKPVVVPTTAGSSPIYTIRNWMGIPVVSGGGVGYPQDKIHAPNENIRIRDYIRSIKFVATLITTYKPEKLRETPQEP
ncbi:MAG: peptidase M20 [Candidatus Bathyarchaeota archaeon B26-1]|nr:MAG: peptidase M20 [Candidatus Bathyarchaeota archaeon B26-1]